MHLLMVISSYWFNFTLHPIKQNKNKYNGKVAFAYTSKHFQSVEIRDNIMKTWLSLKYQSVEILVNIWKKNDEHVLIYVRAAKHRCVPKT